MLQKQEEVHKEKLHSFGPVFGRKGTIYLGQSETSAQYFRSKIERNYPFRVGEQQFFALYVSISAYGWSGFLSFKKAQEQALYRTFALQIQGVQSREPGGER